MVLEHDADMLAHEADLVVAQFAKSWLLNHTLPLLGLVIPEISLRMVDLPEPEWPAINIISPFLIWKLTFFQGFKTAGIGFGNLFETDHKVFLERGQDKLIHS